MMQTDNAYLYSQRKPDIQFHQLRKSRKGMTAIREWHFDLDGKPYRVNFKVSEFSGAAQLSVNDVLVPGVGKWHGRIAAEFEIGRHKGIAIQNMAGIRKSRFLSVNDYCVETGKLIPVEPTPAWFWLLMPAPIVAVILLNGVLSSARAAGVVGGFVGGGLALVFHACVFPLWSPVQRFAVSVGIMIMALLLSAVVAVQVGNATQAWWNSVRAASLPAPYPHTQQFVLSNPQDLLARYGLIETDDRL